MACATAVSQLVSGALWLAVVLSGVAGPEAAHGHLDAPGAGVLAGVALPLLAVGTMVEALVGYGMARFLARVRPDLLKGDA